MMKRMKALALASLSLSFAASICTNTYAAEFTAKLAYVAQPSNPVHKAMEFFAQKASDETNGKLEIKLFHSGQLGGERDYVEGMQLGTIEMAVTSTGILGSFDKSSDVLALPFLFRSSEHLDHTLDGPIGKSLAANYLPKGIRILGYPDFGARYLYDSKRSIRTPEDMKGLKFRAIENPIFIDTYAALGARAVPMARPEVYSALKQGVLDGLDNSLAFYKSMGDYEVAKYLTMGVQLFQTPAALMVSEKFYSKLPSDVQQGLAKAATEAVRYERKIFRAAEDSTLAELKSKGIVVVVADQKPFEELARKVWDKYADKVGGKAKIDAVVNTK